MTAYRRHYERADDGSLALGRDLVATWDRVAEGVAEFLADYRTRVLIHLALILVLALGLTLGCLSGAHSQAQGEPGEIPVADCHVHLLDFARWGLETAVAAEGNQLPRVPPGVSYRYSCTPAMWTRPFPSTISPSPGRAMYLAIRWLPCSSESSRLS